MAGKEKAGGVLADDLGVPGTGEYGSLNPSACSIRAHSSVFGIFSQPYLLVTNRNLARGNKPEWCLVMAFCEGITTLYLVLAICLQLGSFAVVD